MLNLLSERLFNLCMNIEGFPFILLVAIVYINNKTGSTQRSFLMTTKRSNDAISLLAHEADKGMAIVKDDVVKDKVDQDTHLQPDLIHNEKLKALGMMSAGLAHEINNPLNYSILGIELLKQEGRTMMAPEFESVLSDIEDGLLRIKNIVKDLKVYSRKEYGADNITESFLLGDVVASVLRIISKLVEHIEITTTLESPYRLQGEASSIVQVLINLINNSTDSIRQKIARSNTGQYSGRIDIHGSRLDDRYKIEVVDNGMGISKEGIQDLFTPFYTTKTAGNGTGLGMCICHSIIDRHGGKVIVESTLGEWASVSFDLKVDGQP